MDCVDLLVFGPHPDDLEIGMGGTIARHVDRGVRVGLCDLTAGEMGSNGTVEERLAEADAARDVLGAAWRVNLRWPDRGIGGRGHVRSAVELIRRARPRTIAIPPAIDRHPDHVAASQVLTEAAFSSGLRRFEPSLGDAWKASRVCYYFINDSAPAAFVIDVSDVYDRKRRALACYVSQFRPPDRDAVHTRLTSPRFQQLIESRDMQFGALSGVTFAEGFIVRDPIVLQTLLLEETESERAERSRRRSGAEPGSPASE
ncbi:MAG TPA: bacillithiol biosynthesis deacetylase BshB1 [Vicinamibacterales bacterium]|jgi:bacillithiol biosynthesis deacetylase BshB1|nr:bacillithiol biosynthesis deacetylase BshB1 [Vicinamibacterales bacterium]